MFDPNQTLAAFDPEIWQSIQSENRRQEEHIELIASENYTSPLVMEAQGTKLTNKYAEGYPGKRYYGGCEYVDTAEALAIERAKTLFGADYANVQPHSGSQANSAVYAALCEPGDTVLGMSLAHGGDIADEVGAYLLVDMAHVAGLVAAGAYPSPVQIADVTTSTTHKTLRGPRGGIILARANEAVEKKLNSAVFPGGQGGPLMHVIAAKAISFKEAMSDEYKAYQHQVVKNAKAMAWFWRAGECGSYPLDLRRA